jgi:hypothetical protein
MAVARNADGRMEVFARGTDSALIHNWQLGPNTGWANQWMSLGFPPNNPLQSVPAVGRNADGRLEVFAACGTNINWRIWHIFQTAPNNGWSGWNDFGTGGLLLVAPVVAANADGRLEVFAIMVPDEVNEGMLFHKFQLGPGAPWSAWESLGRPPGNPPAGQLGRPGWDSTFPQFDVGRNADGRLEVFVLTAEGVLWHIWQSAPNGDWSEWEPLGLPPGGLDKSPVVARNADGRLEVFAVTPTPHVLWHIWQTAPNNGWSDWAPLGTPPGGTLTSALAVSRNEDGRLEVFGRGLDTRVWHTWQGGPIAGWSAWTLFANLTAALGPAADPDEFPMVGQNADGRLQLFVRVAGMGFAAPGFLVWMTWQEQDGPLGGWSDWKWLASWVVHNGGGFGRGLIEP